MLNGLAQADTARVRAHGYAELGRQQQVRDVLVHSRHPAGVDLQDVDRAGLEQLVHDHPVLGMLAGRDLDRRRPIVNVKPWPV